MKEVIMRRTIAVMAGLLMAGAASAQDLLRDADRDVLNALVFLGRPNLVATASRTLPPDLANLKVASELALIGTSTRSDGSTITAFTTTLPSGRALDELVLALAAEGWALETQQQTGQQPTFSAPTQRQFVMVCRNGERRAAVVRDHDNRRIASIQGGVTLESRPCNAPDPRQNLGPMGLIGARNLMPRLTFPEGVRVANGGGAGGSNGYQRSGTRVFSTEETALSLALELSRQLTTQGWTRDAAWNGAWGAGSNWRRHSEHGPLLGMLEVIEGADSAFEVVFTLNLQH
jgi:hypothetical protein